MAQQDDVVLTLANISYNATDNQVEFDLFMNVDNTDSDGKLYLAGSDFAITFFTSAYGPSADIIAVTTGAPASSFPPLTDHGFFDIQVESPNGNPILDDFTLAGFFNATDPFGKSVTQTEMLISYNGGALAQCAEDLSTCCPFVNTVYADNSSLVHNFGRFAITDVVDQAAAQLIELTTSALIPTDIFGLQEVSAATQNTGCAGQPFTRIQSVSANVTINTGASLPLVLGGFTGFTEANRLNHLQWWTSTEINTSHFEIERSIDGITFEQIGEVVAAGNSENIEEYVFTDQNPVKGANYYRIRMVDQDQTFTYTETIVLTIKADNEGVEIYPSPAIDIVNIDYFSELNQRVQVDVIDVTGKTLISDVYDLTQGFNNNTINVNGLATGSYMLRTTSLETNKINTFKLVKVTP
ncbi:MAG: T9SS type A sorting domain-containing protein [Bacteroidota bacterium]